MIPDPRPQRQATMTHDPEVLPKSDFRQGRRVARNVYHGDEPLFMAATDELAAELVLLLNAGAAALRAPQNDGAAAMREAIARWHDEVADDRARRLNVRDKHREVYDLLFAERVIHRDCARAVRSMPLPPALASQEPGTGGERA